MQSFEKMRENGEKLEKQKMHWLAFYKSNSRYENADMNVLSFIANISFFPDMEFRENDAISHFAYDQTNLTTLTRSLLPQFFIKKFFHKK